MRITRYIIRVFLLAMLLQIAFTALVISVGSPKTIDTNFSRQTIFQTDSKMAVYGSPIVARGSDKPQIVIMGSSNTTMGLRPDRLQPLLGDVPIHNLSVGSERFFAYSQIIDLLYRQTPPENRRNYVFVIGISYPLIMDTPQIRATMRTSIDDEERRFALFAADGPRGSSPRVPNHWLPVALQLNWPLLTPKALYNRIVRLLPESYQFGLAEWLPYSAEESNTIIYPPEQNQARIDYYKTELVDTTGEYTFEPLMRAIAQVTAAGGEVVVVDLPTAKWLQEATGRNAVYHKLRAPYISRLEKMPHVRYINVESGFADEDFYDGVHPRNRITGEIARRVAPTIKQALKDYQ